MNKDNNATSLSQLFKPFTDRIKEILINSKKKNIDKEYSEEEYYKDIDLIKSAFDQDFIDFEEYVDKRALLKAQYDEINSTKQDYADAIIKDNKGKILLLRRAITDTFCPDCWSLPGGKIEKDEKPEQAIIREVKEETNLDVKSFELLSRKKIKGGSIYYFICQVDDLSTIILDNEEHISYNFYEQGGEEWSTLNLILDLKSTLDELLSEDVVQFDLFPTFGKDKSKYSNIIEEIANTHPIAKDIFMLRLFAEDEIEIDDYVDYVEKAYKDDTHKDKLTQLKGKDSKGVQVVKWATKAELKQLARHAKNASQKDLEVVIKESTHPQLREHAHAEIKRREEEEKVKEQKDGYETHEYHGKEFKYDSTQDAHIDEEGNKANPAKLYEYYNQRHREQDNKLKQLSSDLEGSVKQKQALGNKLKKAYYQKLNKTRFVGDEESCYKTALEKLTKMGMAEADIDSEKIKKIINRKLSVVIKKSEEDVFGENASQKAKRLIDELVNNK